MHSVTCVRSCFRKNAAVSGNIAMGTSMVALAIARQTKVHHPYIATWGCFLLIGGMTALLLRHTCWQNDKSQINK